MSQKWWVLISVACGTFMATLDSSIVNIALPTLSKDLGADLGAIKWVVLFYLLMITATLLPMGRLSDQFGRKRFFVGGFLVFILGSALCAAAPSLQGLIAARIIQGLGAAMLMANGPAVITAIFPSEERGKGIGILGMIVSLGLVSGPAVGGLLIHHWGWRSIFLVNIPIGLLGVYFGQRHLPPDAPWDDPWGKTRFDWLGAILQCIFLSALIFLVDTPRDQRGFSILTLKSRITYGFYLLLILAAFIWAERKAKSPVLDLSLFRNRVFSASTVSSFLTFVAYSTVSVLTPFFLESILSLPTSKSGFLMSAIPIAIFVVAPMSGRLSDRWGSRGLSALGAGLAAFGLFGLAGVLGFGGINFGIDPSVVGGWLIVLGLALGIFQSPNNSAIMGSVPLQKLGVASAVTATTRNLGMVIGAGASTELFSQFFKRNHNFIGSLKLTYFVAGVIAIGSCAVSLTKKDKPTRFS